MSINAFMRNVTTQHQAAMERARNGKVSVESRLKDRSRELTDLQAKFDALMKEHSTRFDIELSLG